MSIEQRLFPILSAAVTPVPVYMLHAPQLDDLQPDKVPFIVIERIAGDYNPWDALCGANDEVCDLMLSIDVYALDFEQARRIAEQVRGVMASFESPASPSGEFDTWEPGIRVYRVSGVYSVTDHSPSLA